MTQYDNDKFEWLNPRDAKSHPDKLRKRHRKQVNQAAREFEARCLSGVIFFMISGAKFSEGVTYWAKLSLAPARKYGLLCVVNRVNCF